jgi:hypothetical protein
VRSSALTLPLDIDHTQTTHSRTHTPHTSTRTHTHTIAGPKEQRTQLLGEMSKSMAGFKRAHNLPRATPEPPSSLAPTDQHAERGREWSTSQSVARFSATASTAAQHECPHTPAPICHLVEPNRCFNSILLRHAVTASLQLLHRRGHTHKMTQALRDMQRPKLVRQISKSVLATNNHAYN